MIEPPIFEVGHPLNRWVRREEAVRRRHASYQKPIKKASVLVELEQLRAPLPSHWHPRRHDRVGVFARTIA